VPQAVPGEPALARVEPCRLISLREAAEYLRVSRRTLAHLRAQGRVRVSYVGRRVLVNRADLDAGSASQASFEPVAPG
jgi:excisionase family DNA binding protein